MPTYELACRDCGHRFDKFLMRILRNDDLVCPECGSTEIDRGIGGGVLGSGTRNASAGAPGFSASSCGSSRFG